MNKPEERVIIGEGERAGLPISAPVYVALHPRDVLAASAHVQQIGPLIAERDSLLHSLQRMNLELNQTKLALLDARRELAATLSRELALRNMPFYAKQK